MRRIFSLFLACGLAGLLLSCTAVGGLETPEVTRPTPVPVQPTISPTPQPEFTLPPTAEATQLPATALPAPSEPALASPTFTIPSENITPANAEAFPDPQGYAWQPVVGGLTKPVGLVNAGDGSNRLFVIEQAGVIRIVQDGLLEPQPFLDIRAQVGSQANEQGLLGLAFHPKYPENGYFYVNYTDLQGDTVIARFSVSASDPLRADPASEKRLLALDQPFANHNGGQVIFGPDGYLYLGLGDGGSGGDPLGNGQSLTTLLGKILRIDVDHGDPYAIPPDNPFAQGGGQAEIWAYGLRNPWRFTFDRLTNDLYIADVGQNQWEEIDWLPAGQSGANLGWNLFEGTHPFEGNAAIDAVMPVAEYGHDQGCSVTGGIVYRGAQLPEWQGIYLYGDYCSGLVWGLLRDAQGAWQNKLLFENAGSISAFGEDEQGEVYLVDHGGTIFILAKP